MPSRREDQSKLPLANWAAMIRADPLLLRRFKPRLSINRIDDRKTGGNLVAASAELTATIGSGINVAIIDELHIIGTLGERGSNLVRAVETGQAARDEPLIVYITTASLDEPAGIYRDVDAYARRVLAGEVDDPHFLPVIFEIPPTLDASDPANWWRANPNIGRAVDLDRMEREYHDAEQRSVG